jgi:hypothetical protein
VLAHENLGKATLSYLGADEELANDIITAF